jgi:acyl-CoA synthetase (AMP-forming)/AMP-acid ligase II/thioesterase domain-containing protein/NAD(P)-dependent dehydrogenase (short-subunit alcohol dehydrogenase family)/acyl carrier protein
MTLTGKAVFVKADDRPSITELRQGIADQLQQPLDQITDEQIIEVLLLAESSIEDCVVLLRETVTGEVEKIAYVVLSEPFSEERLRSHLQSFLPLDGLPTTYVPLPRLPLTAAGDVDRQVLTQQAVIDSNLAQQWERKLQNVPAIERAAVVIQEPMAKLPLLHLSDLLPEWKSAPVSEPGNEATITEATTTSEVERSQIPALATGGSLPEEPGVPETLPEVLRQTAERVIGDRIVYLQPDGLTITQSYAGLLEEAERILTGLRQQGLKPEDKVIFQLDHNQDIIPAFWGCILGGFIPVIMGSAPSYRESSSAIDKLCNVWKLLDQPLILTNKELVSSVQHLSQWLPADALKISAIEVLKSNQPDKNHHPCKPDDLVFFNLTSGSTGMPKCIGLTHKNLISRARGTNILCKHDESDVILNWLPFDHIGSISDWHVRCVILGCQLVYASKEYILGRPLNWMDLLSQYRITHSWAPNFAYALVNDALKQESEQTWDLSCVKSLLTAGEAVSSKAVEEFIENLAVYGFKKTAVRPAFGMAEMGSGITYYQPTEAQPLIRHTVDKASLKGAIKRVSPDHPNCSVFTDLGPVIPGVSIRIVDGENNLLNEDTIGFLHVKGDAVSPGYYKNPEVNKEVFLADGWFNTGDLGFISNGHLIVSGRAKETIIINGANYYNHEIEAVVEEVEGVEVSYTAACAVREAGAATEKLAIFFHTSETEDDRLIDLLKQIRQTVVGKVNLNPDYLIPVEKAAIPKTAIGKIQRSQLSKQFEAGVFDSILKQIDVLLGNTNTLPDWFYRKIWRAKETTTVSSQVQVGQSLVFVDQSGFGESLCAALGRDRQSCIAVEAGIEFAQIADNRYCIDPRNPDHYRQLLNAIATNLPITQVIHLWTYGDITPAVNSTAALEAALDAGIYSTLFLIQALEATQKTDRSIRLIITASHAQPTAASDRVAAEKIPVLGLVKAASQEMPWLDCRHIDLTTDSVEQNINHILRELQIAQTEREVAYRNGQRLVPCLEKVDWSQEVKQPLAFKQGGMYVISGGLGGIGVEIAKYLLETYSARLLLLGRVALPERNTWEKLKGGQDAIAQRIETYLSLERLNGEVSYAAVDLTNPDALQQVVDQATAHWACHLDGIIHLAGNAPERSLLEETRDSLSATLQPKVLGTWALHQLIKDQPDSLFISFSSLASFFGGALIGAYAAANSFLDSFTHYLQHHTSIHSHTFAWGMWEGIGMSRNSLAKDLLKAKGYRAVSLQQGLHSMFAGLHHNQRHLLVGLDGSNRNIQRYVEAPLSPSQRLVGYFTTTSDTLDTAEFAAWSVGDRFDTPSTCTFQQLQEMPLLETGEIDRQQLVEMSRQITTEKLQPRNELEQQLAAIWQEVLNISQVGVRDSFFELGGSSLQAARLFAAIEKNFGKNLPLATLFQAPTIEQLVNIIQEDGNSASWSPLVAIQPNGSKPPLFCVHGAGGNVLMYRELIPYLQPDQPLYGLQALGLDGMDSPLAKLEEIAEIYVQEIVNVQPQGPYFLVGLSAGGVIAFEMAQILRKQGQEVALLGLIDTHGPGYPEFLPAIPRLISILPHVFLHFVSKIPNQLTKLTKAKSTPTSSLKHSEASSTANPPHHSNQKPDQELIDEDLSTDNRRDLPKNISSWKDFLEHFSLWMLQFTPWAFVVPRFYLNSGQSIPSKLQKVKEANVRAMLAYKPQIYPGSAILFRATKQPPGCYPDPELGWHDFIDGKIKIYDVPGYHGESLLYRKESLEVLGKCLKSFMDKF